MSSSRPARTAPRNFGRLGGAQLVLGGYPGLAREFGRVRASASVRAVAV